MCASPSSLLCMYVQLPLFFTITSSVKKINEQKRKETSIHREKYTHKKTKNKIIIHPRNRYLRAERNQNDNFKVGRF